MMAGAVIRGRLSPRIAKESARPPATERVVAKRQASWAEQAAGFAWSEMRKFGVVPERRVR